MFHGCGAVLSYWCLVSAADGSTAPTVERSEMGSKDRMYLGVATRPAEEPTQQGHVSPPSAPTSDVSGSK